MSDFTAAPSVTSGQQTMCTVDDNETNEAVSVLPKKAKQLKLHFHCNNMDS